MQWICLRDNPQWAQRTCRWYAEKWGIPYQAYEESVALCLKQKTGVPQWYLAVTDAGCIAGGLGVIENDFHTRVDLTPNVCAVYVEPEFRGKGLARKMLESVCRDMAQMGQSDLYLLTDHTDFYERLGWHFLENIRENSGEFARCYHISLAPFCADSSVRRSDGGYSPEKR